MPVLEHFRSFYRVSLVIIIYPESMIPDSFLKRFIKLDLIACGCPNFHLTITLLEGSEVSHIGAYDRGYEINACLPMSM